MQRFYVKNIDPSDRSIILNGEIVRQLRSVLRFESGKHIRLFDGSGHEWEVEIDHIGKTEIAATLISAVKPSVSPSINVTMLLGLAKPERIEHAIQKCTELGAIQFIPVISERVQGSKTGAPSENRLVRWQRIAIEAAEQCGRVSVPTVQPSMLLMDAVCKVIDSQPLFCMWEEISEQTQSLKNALRNIPKAQSEIAMLIGPPGGFTPNEVAWMVKVGANLVTLGERVLRSETAAIAVLSATLYESGDLGD